MLELTTTNMTWTQRLIAIFGVTLAGAILWATDGCLIADPATGMTCEEYEANPDQDVYFIVASSDFNEEIWASSHQHPETVRWNNDHTQFVVKYDAKSVPRDEVDGVFTPGRPLGNPMNGDEILEALNDPNWLPIDTDSPVVKVKDENEFANDIISE